MKLKSQKITTGFVPISIWEDNIDLIEKQCCYIVTNLTILQYFIESRS